MSNMMVKTSWKEKIKLYWKLNEPIENAHLLPVVRDRLQNGLQRGYDHGNVQQVGGKEKVTEIAHHGQHEIAKIVQKDLRPWKQRE